MPINSVSSPAYSSPSGLMIDLVLDTEEYGAVPYTACQDDPLFARAIAGEFGEIAAYPTPSPETLEDAKARRLAELANRRWRAETGGMVVEGVLVATDTNSQAKITGAALDATLDPAAVVRWKCADGVFRELDAEQVLALARAMRAHVQACFDREAVLMAELQSVTSAAALAAVDIDAGWPA